MRQAGRAVAILVVASGQCVSAAGKLRAADDAHAVSSDPLDAGYCEEEPLPDVLCSSYRASRPRIAVCLGGAARSFGRPMVHRAFREYVVEALGGEVVTFGCMPAVDRSDWDHHVDTQISWQTGEVLAAAQRVGIQSENLQVEVGMCSAQPAAIPQCDGYTVHPPQTQTASRTFNSNYLQSFPSRFSTARRAST